MIVLDSGQRHCTGTLLNNANQDWTPYLLTAHHCADSDDDGVIETSERTDAEDWLFWFNYESAYCNGPDAVSHGTISGATVRSGWDDTDMLLVELSFKPLASYEPYYAGWSRSSNAATSNAVIHHPVGDVKKISLDDETVTLEKFAVEDAAAWYWKVGDIDTGDVEGGSSGSGLFDQNGRIVGQHRGEGAYAHTSCTTQDDRVGYWGAFHLSWEPSSETDEQLRHWLDSGNSYTTLSTIQGYPNPPSNLSISNPTDDGEFLQLSWTGSSTSGVTYNIERCRPTSQYGPCSPYFAVIGSTASTSYTDIQVMIEVPAAPGEPYQRYRVRAVKNSVLFVVHQ